jgi:hypothetical protein
MVYDAAGNLTFDGSFWYQYDAWCRLIQVTAAGTLTAGDFLDHAGGAARGKLNPDRNPAHQPADVLLRLAYDGLGRLVRMDRRMPAGQYASDWRRERYLYDGVRRIQTRVYTPPQADPGGTGGLASSPGEDFWADPNGRDSFGDPNNRDHFGDPSNLDRFTDLDDFGDSNNLAGGFGRLNDLPDGFGSSSSYNHFGDAPDPNAGRGRNGVADANSAGGLGASATRTFDALPGAAARGFDPPTDAAARGFDALPGAAARSFDARTGGQAGVADLGWADTEYVYGPDYVDEHAFLLAAGGEAYYALLDANYNVVGWTCDASAAGCGAEAEAPGAGLVVSQYVYTPYGQPLAAEFPLDADRGAAFPATVPGHQGLFFIRLGTQLPGGPGIAGGAGAASIAVAGWDDPQLAADAVGFYYVRNRILLPHFGRFGQRDMNETALPVLAALAKNAEALEALLGSLNASGHFADGLNLFICLAANPVNGTDALGLYDPFEEVDAWIEDRIGNALYTLGTLNEGAQLALGMAWTVTASLLPGSGIIDTVLILRNGVGGYWDALQIAVNLLPGGKALGAIGKAFKLKRAAKATGAVVKCTGQWHHAISKKVWKALEDHPNLKGKYKYRDERFMTQALDAESHRGYQQWHRDVDKEVAKVLRNPDNDWWTEREFESYLRELYNTDPRLVERFPNGL